MIETPFVFTTDLEKDLLNDKKSRGILKCVNIADIHFGSLDPQYQYTTLKEQFISVISKLDFDILSINGDLFRTKYMSNSAPVFYATLFISDCVELCKSKDATLVLVGGTLDHDAGQLRLFHHYINDPTIDIRIVETTRFEYIKGAKVLIIPEEYDKGKEYYDNFLKYSGAYDLCFMHGTYRGSVHGTDKGTLDCRVPVFHIDDFDYCTGAIFSGHVHKPGVFGGYFHYCGSPYRWEFGQEEDKGYFISVHDLDSGGFVHNFCKIESYRFDTIHIDDLLNTDPKKVIDYVLKFQQDYGSEYIRLMISQSPNMDALANLELIKKYYSKNNKVTVDTKYIRKERALIEAKTEDFMERNSEYSFIMDKTLKPHEILTKYINLKKGYIYITPEELLDLLNNDI